MLKKLQLYFKNKEIKIYLIFIFSLLLPILIIWGVFTKERVLIFLFFWFLLYIYLKLYKKIKKLYNSEDLQLFIINNKTVCAFINKYLMKINNIKNPLLILLLFIDKKLYTVYRNINYYIEKNKIKIKDLNLFLFYLAINLLCLGVLKFIFNIILNFFFNIIGIGKKNTIKHLFVNRLFGFYSIILIFTNIIPVLIQKINIVNCVIVYIVLVIILIVFYKILFLWTIKPDNSVFELKINENRELTELELKINKILYEYWYGNYDNALSSIFLKAKRNNYTILGKLIEMINLNLTKPSIDRKAEGQNCSIIHYTNDSLSELLALNNEVPTFIFNVETGKIEFEKNSKMQIMYNVHNVEYLRNRINIKYFYDLGGCSSFLELNFKYNYLMFKYNRCFYVYDELPCIVLEKKNYPSAFLYYYIIYSGLFFGHNKDYYEDTQSPVFSFMNNLYYEYKIIENPDILKKLGDNEEILKTLEMLQKFDKVRIKLLFYIIWDIEECVDLPNYKYDYWILTKGYEGIALNRKDSYRFVLNDYILDTPISNHYKKENKFYDLEQNLEFFVNVFKYYTIADVLVNFHFDYETNEWNACISEELEVYFKEYFKVKKQFTFLKISRFNLFDDEEHAFKNMEAEEFIKNTLLTYIKTIRVEWEDLKKKQEGGELVKTELKNVETLFLKIKNK